ncbi:hypothetical protein BMS3Bbin04_00667 [bacterium BMS3Bbin04]|nr:hypothetical protein BMS3Bbin04_00667 [bacterium BMS3Bbin04]
MDTEPGHHFVEHQQRAVFVAEAAQSGQEIVVEAEYAHVSWYGFNDHCGDIALVLIKYGAYRIEIVETGDACVLRGAFGHSGTVRCPKGCNARSSLDEESVGMTVIAAREFDNHITFGGGTCQPYRRHRRFGAGVDEANHLHGRHPVNYLLRQLSFQRAGCAEAGTVTDGVLEGGGDIGMRVT